MKNFILNLIMELIAFVLLILLVRVFWCHYTLNHCEKIKTKGVSTLVIGASNTEVSVNDSILQSYINLSQSALWYAANYGSLVWAKEYEGLQIDTVLCGSSLPLFLYYTPGSLSETPERIHRSERCALPCYGDFVKGFCGNIGFIKSLLSSPKISDFFNYSRLGGHFVSLDRNKLNNPHSADNIESYQEKYGKFGFTEEVLRRDSREQVHFLNKIKEYCANNGIVFILFHTPTYHLTDYIDDRGYKDFILHEFGEQQLIADYQDFVFPDTSYYGDLEHLNKKGAEYFSNHIKNYGLNLITAKEYCK